MNAAIANLLSKTLGVWFENFNSEHLNLSIFSGKISLKHLRLKPDFLELLGLPFQLIHGTVDNIEIKIPWSALYSSSISVNISNIIILLAPIRVSCWSADKEKDSILKAKRYYLEHFEAMNPANIELGSNDESFALILANKLMTNLQFTIERLYIRYEDMRDQNEAFAVGILIKETMLFSCNNLWEPDHIGRNETYFKLLLINELSVFLDYGDGIIVAQQWYDGEVDSLMASLVADESEYKIFHKHILRPLSLRLEVSINRDSKNTELPPLSINVLSDSASLHLYIQQIELLFSIKKLINEHFLFKKSIENQIHYSNFSPEAANTYKATYSEFRMIDQDALSAEKDKFKATLEILEENVSIDDIKIQRTSVLTDLKIKEVEMKKLKEISQITLEKKPSLAEKIFQIVVRKTEEQLRREEEERIERLKTAEKDLRRAQFRTSSMVRQMTRSNMKKLEFVKDAIERNLRISISVFSLQFSEEKKELMKIEIKELSAELIMRLASICTSLKLSKCVIWNKFTENPTYPALLKSDLLKIDYESLTSKKIKAVSENFQFFFDIDALAHIISLAQQLKTEHHLTDESLDSDSEKTEEEGSAVMEFFKNFMQNGVISPMNIDLTVVNAEFIMPLENFNEDSGVLRCGFGKFEVSTQRVNGEKVYDVYKVEISGVKAETEGLRLVSNVILDPFSAEFKLLMSKLRIFHVGYRLEASFDALNFYMHTTQVNFLKELIKRYNKIFGASSYTRFASINSIQEHLAVPTFFKSCEEVIKTKFYLKIKEFSVLFSSLTTNFRLRILKPQFSARLSKLKKIFAQFSTDTIEIVDLSLGTSKIILRVPFKTHELNASLTEKPIKLDIFYFPVKDLIDTELKIQAISVELNESSINSFTDYYNSVIDPSCSEINELQLQLHQNDAKWFNFRFIVSIEEFMFVHHCPAADWSRISLCLSLSSIYSDSSSISNNSSNLQPNIQECSLMLSHLIIELHSSQTSKALNSPLRLTFNYESTPSSIPSHKVALHCEQGSFIIGFRDLYFLRKLQDTYLNFPQTSRGSKDSSLTLSFDSLSLILVDDTSPSPYPLLSMKSSSFLLTRNSTNNHYFFLISGSASVNSFNQKLRLWEPFLESFKALGSIEGTATESYDLTFSSSTAMEVNLTCNIAKNLGTALRKFQETPESWDPLSIQEVQLKQRLDYEIKNLLGVKITIIIASCKNLFRLNPLESLRLKYSEIDNLYYIANSRFQPIKSLHCIQLISADFFLAGLVITIEENAPRTIEVSGSDFPIIRKEVRLTEFDRIIELSNATSIVNNTDGPITVRNRDEFVIVENRFIIPMNWRIDEVFVEGWESGCIGSKRFWQLEQDKFVCVERRSWEVEGKMFEDCFVVQPAYLFRNHLPSKVELIGCGYERVLDNGGCLKVFTRTAGELRLCIKNTSASVLTPPFRLEGPGNVRILTECNWKIKINIESPQNLCTEVTFSCESVVMNLTQLDIQIGRLHIPRETLGYLSPKQEKPMRISITKPEPSDVSGKFSITTVGLPECIRLNAKSDPSIHYLLGLQISYFQVASTIIKVLKFYPRYVLKNQLPFTIYIKQLNSKNIFPLSSQRLLHFPYDFQAIQISSNEIDWSSGFALTNIDDFQLKVKASLKGPDEKWWEPSQMNDFCTIVRVSIFTENQTSLNVCFRTPADPDFTIFNNTDLVIEVFEDKCERLSIGSGYMVPWIFERQSCRKINLNVEGVIKKFPLEKISGKNNRIGKFSVKQYSTGNTRVLEIYQNQSCGGILLQEEVNYFSVKRLRFSLAKLNFAIFNIYNKETALISMSGVEIKYKTKAKDVENQSIIKSKMNLLIAEMQIDNMSTDLKLFPVLLNQCRTSNDTPYLELAIEREVWGSPTTSNPIKDIIHIFQLQIQPTQLNVNHEVLLGLLSIRNLLMESYYNTAAITLPTEDLSCVYTFPTLTEDSTKTYFKLINIHTLLLKLTFRKSKDPILFKSSSPFLTLLSNNFFSFAGVTGSPLNLKEIVLTHSYQNRYSLFWLIISNYCKQGLHQFYRILGASHILGNPIGLLDKLGTGVAEFFSQPAKGLLTGPQGFLKGVKNGTKALVSNVIIGGLDSVSDITGTWYNIVSEEQSNSQNFFKDIGLLDISKGIKGVAYKPYQGFKKKGFAGLAKGISSGIFGVSVAPIAALLHVSHTISEKLVTEAKKMNLGQGQQERKRFSRAFAKDEAVVSYDNELHEVYAKVFSLPQLIGKDVKFFVYFKHEVVIITEEWLYVLAGHELIKELRLHSINTIEVHYTRNHFVLIVTSGEENIKLWSNSPIPALKLYYILSTFR